MMDFDFLTSARRTVALERDALERVAARIDEQFTKACKYLLSCQGKVIVTGIGKSGHIANKIAATLASTGTPAFFVHPSEASHGDFGMISSKDVVIAISNSGASAEILTLVPLIKRLGITLISLTGKIPSPLADAADASLDISVESEACPLDLAPTSSTTATLAIGDALAVALLEARGFTQEDFAFSHPGGALGKKLLLRVSDVMHDGGDIPEVSKDTHLRDALTEMTSKGFGMTTVVSDSGTLQGIFTDGDLRRCVDKGININTTLVGDVMTANPHTVNSHLLAAEALHLMESNKITALVVEEQGAPKGVLHMHDLLRAGII